MNGRATSVRWQGSFCFLQLNRPEANNAIDAQLVEECASTIERCRDEATVVVVEGRPEVFCTGADFKRLAEGGPRGQFDGPEPLYDLWTALATGPFVSVAHVRGKANAGGMGFVAACDIVIADGTAEFSLSELLFGLIPACVLPFLIRKIGAQRANYLSLMTRPVAVAEAHRWGLVDAWNDDDSAGLVRSHLLRLRPLRKVAIARQKQYLSRLLDDLQSVRAFALQTNRDVFTDPENQELIRRFVESGRFPWEA